MLKLRNFILLSLAILTVVLLSRETETTADSAESVDALLQENFDYYITGMNSSRFDLAGKLTYKLETTRATHYPETDMTKMENPHFLYFSEETLPWELTAATGTLGKHPVRTEEHLELIDDVVIRHTMQNGDLLVATTDSLDAFPDSNEVDTDSPVTLDVGGSHIESTGLRAFLNEEKIEQTDVRASHE